MVAIQSGDLHVHSLVFPSLAGMAPAPGLRSASKLEKGSFPLLLLVWVLASQDFLQDPSHGPLPPPGQEASLQHQ